MFRSMAKLAFASAAAAVTVGVLGASPAFADGWCGNDFNGPTACQLTTSGSYSGTLTTYGETDFFVFWARKGTALSLTLTDTESATSCVVPRGNCGTALAALDDSQTNTIATTPNGATVNSAGVTVNDSFAVTLKQTGTYYLRVYGSLGSDSNVNPTPVPYTFQISGTPNVQWPPPCAVPKVGRRMSLARAEHMILIRGCLVGAVTREHSKRVKRGDVITLSPRSGTSVAYHTPVAIKVSSGRAPRARKRRSSHSR